MTERTMTEAMMMAMITGHLDGCLVSLKVGDTWG